MHSLANRVIKDRNHTPFIWLLLLLALVGYVLPWLVSLSASLSLNAYDLAEWASLPPAARASNPPLVSSLLLRLPLVCVALIIGFHQTPPNAPSYYLLLVVAIAIAMLPPLEFFTQASSDPNYRQQFALSLIALIGGLLGSRRVFMRFRGHLLLVFALLGGAACIGGLADGYSLMRQMDVPVQVGSGGVVLAVIFFVIALVQSLKTGARAA